MINKTLHRPEGEELSYRTLADFMEHFGNRIAAELTDISKRTLQDFQFEPETGLPMEEASLPPQITAPFLPEDSVKNRKSMKNQIQRINEQREIEAQIKRMDLVDEIEPTSNHCCYISIDDIGVKHQKEQRLEEYIKTKKYVENTVIHVQADGCSSYLTAVGMDQAFSILIAFLLKNGLMENRRLIFFTDGANDIKTRIERFFAFRPFTIVLDWFHLKKKCKELVSSSFKGGKSDKQEIIQSLLRKLWVGNTDEAIQYLDSMEPKKVKSAYWRDELVGYIKRKSSCISCYALRAELNLRISSNRVEKANDLLVGQRQKHNGMSWSYEGSGALAAITMTILNGETERWLRTGSLSFSMPQNSGKAA